MDSNFLELGSNSLSAADSDFAFAFNDRNFSDRVLLIEISTGVVETKSEDRNCSRLLGGWTNDEKKKRRKTEDTGEKENALDAREEHNLNRIPEQNNDHADGYDDHKEEEAVEMHEESPLVHKEVEDVEMQEESPLVHKEKEAVEMQEDSPLDHKEKEVVEMQEDSPSVRKTNLLGNETAHNVRVKKMHINSLILASKSKYFYEIFSNETEESKNKQVTLQIRASEEVALTDLLRFMYSNTLVTNSSPGFLQVLRVADKFKVPSCIRYCAMSLQNLPMTCESALIYLHLLSSVRMANAVKPLVNAAKKHLATYFEDFTKNPQELLRLPLIGVEAVLESNELQLPTEDTVYEYIHKWASLHYSDLDERRKIMSTRLCRLVRFHHMSSRKLRKVLTCSDLDSTASHKFVLQALFFKSEPAYRQRQMFGTGDIPLERNYKYRMAKMVEFESPHPQCIVYIDLKREECERLRTLDRTYVQTFPLNGEGFFLSAKCILDEETNANTFGLFLGMQDKGLAASVSVDYEFWAMWKPNQEFERKYEGSFTFVGGNVVGYRNLFNLDPDEDFLAEDSVYFIDDILHLKVEVTIKK